MENCLNSGFLPTELIPSSLNTSECDCRKGCPLNLMIQIFPIYIISLFAPPRVFVFVTRLGHKKEIRNSPLYLQPEWAHNELMLCLTISLVLWLAHTWVIQRCGSVMQCCLWVYTHRRKKKDTCCNQHILNTQVFLQTSSHISFFSNMF